MLHGSHSPGVAGSELTRLLAHLADAPAAEARPAFAERLGHWLSWTDAISLSGALSTAPAESPRRLAHEAPNLHRADFDRVRATLEASIAAGPRDTVQNPTLTPADFTPHRRHCQTQQQAMQDAVGALRQRLRDALSRRSAAGARLAAIDAVMAQALAPQERHLLGLVPLRLLAHFERLQRSATDHPAWAEAFHADMAHVLRAELAHRLLPAQGLLAAFKNTAST